MRLIAALAVAALLVAGCTKPAPEPQAVLGDLDDASRWVAISIAEFNRECPDVSPALAAGTLKLPDPHRGLVSNMGLQTFKVRIENGVVKEAWRQRTAE